MKIALTGGSGFVGRHVIDALSGDGFELRALRNTAPLPRHDTLEIIDGSLEDNAALARLVDGADCIIHIGGLVKARGEGDFDAINARATRDLARLGREAGVKRFLLISSLAARRPQISAYAASKKKAETSLMDEAGREMGWDVIRPPAIYGPGDKQVLSLFRILKKGVALMPGGEDARFSLIHVADLARAIRVWAESGKATQSVYELDDGCPGGHGWREVMGRAAGAIGTGPRFIAPPRGLLLAYAGCATAWGRVTGQAPFITMDKVRELSFKDWVCEDTGFGKSFDWAPQTGFEKGVDQTIAWYKEQGWL